MCKDHELHLLTFAQNDEDFSYKGELEKVFSQVHLVSLPKWKSAINCLSAFWDATPLQVLYFRSAEMNAKLASLLESNQYDAVHVQHLRMSPYFKGYNSIPRILDMPDAFSLYWKRRKRAQQNPFLKIFETLEYNRVLRYEKEIMPLYQMSLVCSQEDLEYLQKEQGIKNVQLLPNGVDLDVFKAKDHDYSHNHTILFTGNMDYAPNVDAVLYFVEELLPSIRKQYPQTKFVIAGQRPIKKVQQLANDHIEVTGFVEDIAAMYDSASVVVAPLRFGAGTQNKVLEAMAMGIPVICSNIGFKGLGIESGEGAIMETEPERFTKAVLSLLESETKRREVGQKGKEVILGRFGWDAIAKQLEQYFRDVKSI